MCTLKNGTISKDDAVIDKSGSSCGIAMQKIYSLPPYNILNNVRLDGNLLGVTLNMTLENCIEKCKTGKSLCKSVTFHKPSNECYFYDEEDPPKINFSENDYTSITHIVFGKSV